MKTIFGILLALSTLISTSSQASFFIQDGSVTYSKLAAGAVGRGNVVSKTSTYGISATTDNTILCSSGSFSVTLPTAVGIKGKVFTIKKTDSSLSNIITIATTSAQLIDGVSTKTLNTYQEQFTVQSDNANWVVLDHSYDQSWSSPVSVTITGATGTNPVKGATPPTDSLSWKRVGAGIQERILYNQVNAGTSGVTGDYLFPTPSGISADTSIVSAQTTSGSITSAPSLTPSYLACTGQATATNGSHYGSCEAALLYDSTHFRITITYDFATNNNIDTTHIPLSGANTAYAFTVFIPVSGWSP